MNRPWALSTLVHLLSNPLPQRVLHKPADVDILLLNVLVVLERIVVPLVDRLVQIAEVRECAAQTVNSGKTFVHLYTEMNLRL